MKFNTVTTSNKLGLTPFEYIRVSRGDQDEARQKRHLSNKRLTPTEFEVQHESGESSPLKRLQELPYKSLIMVEHSDRILKSKELFQVEELIDTLKKASSMVLLDSKEIIKAKRFHQSPSLEALTEHIRKRIIETTPRITTREFNSKELKAISKAFKVTECWGALPWGDLALWRCLAFFGYAVNRVHQVHSKKARELQDKTFGNQARHVRIFQAIKRYQEKGVPLKDWPRSFSKNLDLTTQTGTQLTESYLSKLRNQEWIESVEEVLEDASEAYKLDSTTLPPPEDILMQPTGSKMKKSALAMGFSRLKREQVQTLNMLRLGLNVVLSTRTGGGKSQLPPLYAQMNPDKLVLVVIPTLKLNENLQQKWSRLFPEGAIRRYDSKGDPKLSTLKDIKAGAVRLLLTTPNALRDATKLRAALKQRGVGLMVIDEAHNVVHAAKTYRPEYALLKIKEAWKDLGQPQFLMTTATLDHLTEKMLKIFMWPFKIVRGNLERPNLMLHYHQLPSRGAKMIATYELLQLVRQGRKGKTLVFFSTVKDLMSAKETLEELKLAPHVYFSKEHPKVKAREKREHLEAFAASPNGILLTTCAFGEGIDIPGVYQVICFGMPSSLVELAQWAGRGGRNNKPAHIWLFSDPHAKKLREFMIDGAKTKGQRRFAQLRWVELLEFLDANPNPTLSDVNNALKGIYKVEEATECPDNGHLKYEYGRLFADSAEFTVQVSQFRTN